MRQPRSPRRWASMILSIHTFGVAQSAKKGTHGALPDMHSTQTQPKPHTSCDAAARYAVRMPETTEVREETEQSASGQSPS